MIFVCLLIFMQISILDVQSQSTTMTASVTISHPATSYTLITGSDLSFGTLELSSATGGAAVVPTAASNADASRFTITGGVTQTGSPSWGTAIVQVNNTSTYPTVAFTYPAALRKDSCSGSTDSNGKDCTIDFTGGANGWSATEPATTYANDEEKEITQVDKPVL